MNEEHIETNREKYQRSRIRVVHLLTAPNPTPAMFAEIMQIAGQLEELNIEIVKEYDWS